MLLGVTGLLVYFLANAACAVVVSLCWLFHDVSAALSTDFAVEVPRPTAGVDCSALISFVCSISDASNLYHRYTNWTWLGQDEHSRLSTISPASEYTKYGSGFLSVFFFSRMR